MAKLKYNSSVEEITGSLNKKNGLTIRQKTFHDFDGNVTRVGRMEAYKPNKRDFKKNPPLICERANMTAFGNSSHLAQELISAAKNKTPLSPEKQALLDSYMERFYAQLKGKPDPIAHRDKDGKYTIYVRPDNFIRAVIHVEKPQILSD